MTSHIHYFIMEHNEPVSYLSNPDYRYSNSFSTRAKAEEVMREELAARPNDYYDRPRVLSVAERTVPYCVANEHNPCEYASTYDEIYPFVACSGGCGKKNRQLYSGTKGYTCLDCQRREMREKLSTSKRHRETFPSRELPHLWVHQAIPRGRVAGGNESFDGPNYSSYGLVIGGITKNKKGEKVVLLHKRNNSVTTNKHITQLMCDIPRDLKTFVVADPEINYQGIPEHKANIAAWTRAITDKVKDASTSRAPKNERLLREASDVALKAREYIAFFGVKGTKLPRIPKDVDELKKMYAKEIAKEKAAEKQRAKLRAEQYRERIEQWMRAHPEYAARWTDNTIHTAEALAQEFKDKEDAEYATAMTALRLGELQQWMYSHPSVELQWNGEWIQGKELQSAYQQEELQRRFAEQRKQWLAGRNVSYPYAPTEDTQLRVVDNEVETSRGARFPIAHARLGLALVRRTVASGTEWRRNGRTLHLGHYQIDRITADGTVYAGCHTVTLVAIERIAAELERA